MKRPAARPDWYRLALYAAGVALVLVGAFSVSRQLFAVLCGVFGAVAIASSRVDDVELEPGPAIADEVAE